MIIKEWFVSAIWACKNITRRWTGVCFPVSVSQQWVCDTRAVKGEYPPTTGFLFRPLWWNSFGSPAGDWQENRHHWKRASQPVSQWLNLKTDQLVSHSDKSVTAGGGLAFTARRDVKEDSRAPAYAVTAHYSCLTVHTAFGIWICYPDSRWRQQECLSVHVSDAAAWGFTLYAVVQRESTVGYCRYDWGSWTRYKYPHALSGWSVGRSLLPGFFFSLLYELTYSLWTHSCSRSARWVKTHQQLTSFKDVCRCVWEIHFHVYTCTYRGV